MSKTRCPQCGGNNEPDAFKCRLCGYDLTGSVQEILPQKGARIATKSSSGLGGVFLLGIAGVVILAAVAVFFGVRGSDEVVSLAENVPGIQPNLPDGWEAVNDESGGFTAMLPGTATQTTEPFAPLVDGEVTVWTAWVADEIELTIAYGDLDPAFVEAQPSAVRRLDELASAWAATQGGRVRDRTEGSFRGARAYQMELAGQELSGERATGRSRVWVRGDRFWAVTVITNRVNADNQFERVLNSVNYTAGAEASANRD